MVMATIISLLILNLEPFTITKKDIFSLNTFIGNSFANTTLFQISGLLNRLFEFDKILKAINLRLNSQFLINLLILKKTVFLLENLYSSQVIIYFFNLFIYNFLINYYLMEKLLNLKVNL